MHDRSEIEEILQRWRQGRSLLETEGTFAATPDDVFADASQVIEMAKEANIRVADLVRDEEEHRGLAEDAAKAQPYDSDEPLDPNNTMDNGATVGDPRYRRFVK